MSFHLSKSYSYAMLPFTKIYLYVTSSWRQHQRKWCTLLAYLIDFLLYVYMCITSCYIYKIFFADNNKKSQYSHAAMFTHLPNHSLYRNMSEARITDKIRNKYIFVYITSISVWNWVHTLILCINSYHVKDKICIELIYFSYDFRSKNK